MVWVLEASPNRMLRAEPLVRGVGAAPLLGPKTFWPFDV